MDVSDRLNRPDGLDAVDTRRSKLADQWTSLSSRSEHVCPKLGGGTRKKRSGNTRPSDDNGDDQASINKHFDQPWPVPPRDSASASQRRDNSV